MCSLELMMKIVSDDVVFTVGASSSYIFVRDPLDGNVIADNIHLV